MTRYLWALPIQPGKTRQLIRNWQEESQRRHDPQYMNAVEEVWEAEGLHDYNAWIQHTHEGDYLIAMVNVESWNGFLNGFRQQIQEKNPHALFFQQLWLDTLGIDFGQENILPEPIFIGESHISNIPENKIISHAICYPILSGHEEGRYEFHELVSGKKAKEFQKLCKEHGISHMSRHLFKNKQGTFYIVYQEFNIDNFDRVHDFLTNPRLRKKNHWIWDGLIEDTGWTMEQLIPHIDYLKEKPPVAIGS